MPADTECSVDMQVQAHIPESYIDSTQLRLEVYRMIADIKDYDDASDVTDELIDRFGEPPAAVQGLIDIALMRNLAASLGIDEVKQQGSSLLLFKQNIDMKEVSALVAAMKGRVMLSVGSRPYISVALSGKEPLEVLEDTLQAMQEIHKGLSEK
jgi:transcription-repair coupling factor (superfamily II helicase)